MIVENNYRIAISPGEYMKELLQEKEIDLNEFAFYMEMTEREASELLDSDIELNEDIAMKLESIFGMSTEYWMNLESAFRAALARIEYDNALETGDPKLI